MGPAPFCSHDMNLSLELESAAETRRFRNTDRPIRRRDGKGKVLALAALGVVLMLPSLRTGWQGDDIVHRLVMTKPDVAADLGVPNENSPTGLFTFLDGKPSTNSRLRAVGVVPWWTHDHVKSSFLRPVAWVTHWLDFRFWPNGPGLMHLQSLAWYAGLVLVVGMVFRSLFDRGSSPLVAALFFALDDAHATAAGWIANRNAVLAAFFGIATLLAHVHWRRSGSRLAAAIAPVSFLLALLSSEGAATAGALLLAFAIFLERNRWSTRLLSLAPYVLVGAAWRGAWAWLGFGSEAMGLYTDPTGEPLRFLAALVERAPFVFLSALAGVPAEAGMFLGPALHTTLWAAGIALPLLLFVVLWPMLKRDAVARFFAVSTVLAIVPCCVTIPSDRNLLFVSFAAMGLLGRFVNAAWNRASTSHRGRTSWVLSALPVGLIVLVHGLIAPAAKPVRAAMPLGPEAIARQLEINAVLPGDVDQKYLVVVNAPSVFHLGYLPVRRALAGEPVPKGIRVLGASMAGLSLRRVDERTLHVSPDGGYLKGPFDQVFRGPQVPLKDGERVELSGVSVRVAGLTNDGRPASAVFEFDRPVEDESLVWLQWVEGEFVPFTPPGVGESATVAGAVPSWQDSDRSIRTPEPTSSCALAEQTKIERLISHIERSTELVFIRNGVEYRGTAAAGHLRNKWEHKRGEITTARQFIAEIATVSGLTGRAYEVRRSDGRVQRMEEFLLEALVEIETTCR